MIMKIQYTGPFFPENEHRICNETRVRPSDRFSTLKTIFSRFVEVFYDFCSLFLMIFPWYIYIYIEREISSYTMYRKQRNNKHRNKQSLIFRFMLDGKKVYKSTLVCPFGILMG